MNKVTEFYDLWKKDKKQFEQNGKLRKEIISIPPFSATGSFEDLKLIRNIYGREIEAEDINNFIIILENWL